MAEAKAQDAAAEGKGSGFGWRKLLLFGGGAVFLLVLGGGVTAFFLTGNEPAPGDGEAAVEVEEDPGEPTYYKLDPEFVVNLPPGGKAKLLQVGLEVYTTDPAVTEVLQRHTPMLRHHLFDVLSSQETEGLFTRDGRERLQEALQRELRQKLAEAGEEEPKIDAVYFTQFVLQ